MYTLYVGHTTKVITLQPVRTTYTGKVIDVKDGHGTKSLASIVVKNLCTEVYKGFRSLPLPVPIKKY